MHRLTLLLLIAATTLIAGTDARSDTAVFAGGCFWCLEADLDRIPGVTRTVSGYIGGTVENPTYRLVSSGKSGHYEAVQVTFDARRISYDRLVDAFFHAVDPTDAGGQFCDRGTPYRTAIFAQDNAQLKAAASAKSRAARALGRRVATVVRGNARFHPAEDYHQNYYKKNPLKYRYYRLACGRNAKVKKIWGKRAYDGIPGPW